MTTNKRTTHHATEYCIQVTGGRLQSLKDAYQLAGLRENFNSASGREGLYLVWGSARIMARVLFEIAEPMIATERVAHLSRWRAAHNDECPSCSRTGKGSLCKEHRADAIAALSVQFPDLTVEQLETLQAKGGR